MKFCMMMILLRTDTKTNGHDQIANSNGMFAVIFYTLKFMTFYISTKNGPAKYIQPGLIIA